MTLLNSARYAEILSMFGWSLFHLLWQGTILGVALAVALKFSGAFAARVRYVLCCAVFVGLLLCLVLTFVRLAVVTNDYSKQESRLLIAASDARPTQPASSKRPIAEFNGLLVWIGHHMAWALVIWSTGVLLGCGRVSLALITAKRLRTISVKPVPHELDILARQIANRLHVVRPFRVSLSDALTAPALIGFRRPTILFPPASLNALTLEQTESILAHEIAHIRRQDYLINLLQTVVEALLFFHPAVWWASSQIRKEREHCCDDLAVEVTGSALVYVKALTALEEQRSPANQQLSLGVSGGRLSMRIKRLITFDQRTHLTRNAAVSLVSIGLATCCLLTTLSLFVTDHVAAQTAGSTAPVQTNTSESAKSVTVPDLSCTFYDKGNKEHPGSCERDAPGVNAYSCRQNDKTHSRQTQTGCEWKVQRFEEWKINLK